jgi:general secretion pathway protein E
MNETLITEPHTLGNEAAPRRPPFMFAKRHGVLVTGYEGDKAIVVHTEKVAPATLVELRRLVGRPIRLQQIEQEDFDALLANSYEQGSSEAMQMMGDLGEDMDLMHVAQALPEPEDLLESEDDAPIIRLINALLTEAVKENASDIHIEPFENRLVVRFRCDGVLREVLEPQRVLASLLVSRI